MRLAVKLLLLVAALIVCTTTADALLLRTRAFRDVDYICRGSDPRVLGRTGAILQQVLSLPFARKHRAPSREVRIGSQQVVPFPPFVAINLRRRDGKWATMRFGWRWDNNCGRYIADVILKLDWPTPLYY